MKGVEAPQSKVPMADQAGEMSEARGKVHAHGNDVTVRSAATSIPARMLPPYWEHSNIGLQAGALAGLDEQGWNPLVDGAGEVLCHSAFP